MLHKMRERTLFFRLVDQLNYTPSIEKKNDIVSLLIYFKTITYFLFWQYFNIDVPHDMFNIIR